MDCNHMRSGSSKNCIFCGKFCSRSSFFGRKAPPKRTYADELKESLQYFAAATALFGGDEDKDSDEQDETPSPPKVMKVAELPQKNSLSKKQAVPPKENAPSKQKAVLPKEKAPSKQKAVPPKENAPSKQKAVPHKKNGPSKQQAVPQKQTVPSKQRDDSKKSRS